MLEEMPGPGLADAARQGAQTSRVTAKKPWQLGVALLTLFGAAVLPERSLVLPQDKAPLHESMYAEGRRLYAAVNVACTTGDRLIDGTGHCASNHFRSSFGSSTVCQWTDSSACHAAHARTHRNWLAIGDGLACEAGTG